VSDLTDRLWALSKAEHDDLSVAGEAAAEILVLEASRNEAREERDGFEAAAELWQQTAEACQALLPPFEGPAIRDLEGRWHRACLVAHHERPGEWCWQPIPELKDGDS
jgi:hypothetical protein